MTPRIGASGADRSTALAPGLDRPGVNPVPRTGAFEATGPQGLERPGGSGKLTSAWNPDWNVRGSNAAGLEHRGGGSPGPECPGLAKATAWHPKSIFCSLFTQPRDRSRRKKNQENDAPPEEIKRKIVFSDLRNPPNNFTPLFGEVAKFRTLTKKDEQ